MIIISRESSHTLVYGFEGQTRGTHLGFLMENALGYCFRYGLQTMMPFYDIAEDLVLGNVVDNLGYRWYRLFVGGNDITNALRKDLDD